MFPQRDLQRDIKYYQEQVDTVSIVLPYHEGDDGRFSLDFISDQADALRTHLEGREHEDARLLTKQQHIDEDRILYLVYSKRVPATIDLDGVFDEADLERFTGEQLAVLELILDIFEGVVRTKNRAREFQYYKTFDIERIPSVLQYPAWGDAPVRVVAGQLLSRFVQSHPLPNANHRTAIGLVERYLRSVSEGFIIPDTGERGTWYAWARPFMHDSKILLTVRRRSRLFGYAKDIGVDVFQRKDGLEIVLADYDFEVNEPYMYYGREHERRSIRFIETILDESNADASDLQDRIDPGWKVFVDSLTN